ncbi:MAG: alpha-amylase family glycosyl hydrolase [Flavobacteriales bacterium]
MKKIFQNLSIVLICCMALAACNNSDNDKLYISHITGLASPVQLKYDTTMVHITDYFPDAIHIESIVLDGKKLVADTATRQVIITGGLDTPLGNMQVTFDGVVHDIPVFKSDKVKHRFTYKATSDAVQTIELAGSMNGWNRKATPLKKDGDQWVTDLVLNQGLYQYRVWEDGNELMDANNANTISNGMGGLNNTFQVGRADVKSPQIISSSASDSEVVLLALSDVTHAQAYWENTLTETTQKGDSIVVRIPACANQLKRSHLRVYAHNGSARSNDVLIPLQNGKAITKATELDRHDMHGSVMYFMMVDRFADGDATNNRPTLNDSILPQANNLGGDLAGITKKIEEGYFKNLGINTLWISPITTNAEGAWGFWKDKQCDAAHNKKCVSSKFSAYHGYWPAALRTIDNRFGNDTQMKELLSVAHANNMNVILDYVAHHVHQEHPLYKQKPDWTTPLYLPDGRMNTELWDEQRLTTWFDTFLPTWNFANEDVVHALTDTAMYWVEEFELDGFRHDATKHIQEEFWRELTYKVKAFKAKNPERHIYQVGETYGNPELIASYIGSGQMDAQFDFNLYDAAVDAFAKNESTLSNLVRVMNESMKYYGSHHLMGNITGNQDRARFISYADGSVRFDEDAKHAGWTRTIENRDSTGFQKLKMLTAFLMTTPGIPCIYYGDEIGMPGANDPDNRRMMNFSTWNKWQQHTFERTNQLVHIRRTNMPLMYGDMMMLHEEENCMVYARTYLGQTALVVLNKSDELKKIKLNVPDALMPNRINYLNGTECNWNQQTKELTIEPWSYEVIGDIE